MPDLDSRSDLRLAALVTLLGAGAAVLVVLLIAGAVG